jgi:hypothetical protein
MLSDQLVRAFPEFDMSVNLDQSRGTGGSSLVD